MNSILLEGQCEKEQKEYAKKKHYREYSDLLKKNRMEKIRKIQVLSLIF